MKTEFKNKLQSLEYKTPIITLLITSLFLLVLGFIGPRFLYDYTASWTVVSYAKYYFPFLFIPCALFSAYLFLFHNNVKWSKKTVIIVPIVFGLIALKPILEMDLLGIIFVTIPFAFATFNALKGFSNSIYLYIAIGLGVVFEIFIFSRYLSYLLNIEIVLVAIINRLGTIAFYVSLLLFGLKNKIPPIISTKPKFDITDPEDNLKLLKEKLDLGIITEEEYHTQRTEIINNL